MLAVRARWKNRAGRHFQALPIWSGEALERQLTRGRSLSAFAAPTSRRPYCQKRITKSLKGLSDL